MQISPLVKSSLSQSFNDDIVVPFIFFIAEDTNVEEAPVLVMILILGPPNGKGARPRTNFATNARLALFQNGNEQAKDEMAVPRGQS